MVYKQTVLLPSRESHPVLAKPFFLNLHRSTAKTSTTIKISGFKRGYGKKQSHYTFRLLYCFIWSIGHATVRIREINNFLLTSEVISLFVIPKMAPFKYFPASYFSIKSNHLSAYRDHSN
jgi:hypothetical protein